MQKKTIRTMVPMFDKFVPIECLYTNKFYVNCYGNKDYYKHYLKTRKHQADVDYRTYCLLVSVINKLIMKYLMEGHHIQLPIGTFKIVRKKVHTGSLQINFHESRKQNKMVYHINPHTNFEYVKFKWVKFKYARNLNLYTFIPSRTNKRLLSRMLKDSPYLINNFTTSREIL
jgi:hypothetical protein